MNPAGLSHARSRQQRADLPVVGERALQMRAQRVGGFLNFARSRAARESRDAAGNAACTASGPASSDRQATAVRD